MNPPVNLAVDLAPSIFRALLILAFYGALLWFLAEIRQWRRARGSDEPADDD